MKALAPREKPIIFCTDMVQAILENRKTQTRRVIKPQPEFAPYANDSFGIPFWKWKDCQWIDNGIGMPTSGVQDYAPYQPGDTLWVREAFCLRYFGDGSPAYKADYHKEQIGSEVPEPKWKPSIHMPRTAARIFLPLELIRAEKLQDITDEDAIAEGIYEVRPGGWHWKDPATTNTPKMTLATTPRQAYMWLWNAINEKRGFPWASNPWVWVIVFAREEHGL